MDEDSPSARVQQQQSRSCSRARRSGSNTPVLGGGSGNRLPSRPSSPSRLRSLPSVGLSNVEAVYSDAAFATSPVIAAIDDHVDEEGEDSGRSKEALLPVGYELLVLDVPYYLLTLFLYALPTWACP